MSAYDKGVLADAKIPSFVMIVVGTLIAILMTNYSSMRERKQREDKEKEMETYSKRLKDAIIPEQVGEVGVHNDKDEMKQEVDALGRMMINLEDIKEFYTWSQKQAKASFKLAIVMCVLGVILIIIAIVLSVLFRENFHVSTVATIGGVITELFAGTALVVYKSSLTQLNYYHKALHEDERFLSSVNLLGKFSDVGVHDEMLKELIRSEMQMNLTEIKEKCITQIE